VLIEINGIPKDNGRGNAALAQLVERGGKRNMERVGVLRNPRNPANALQLASINQAAATLGLLVEVAEAGRRDAI
jgi:hypothetical protein